MENFDEYNVALQTAILNPTKLAFSLPADIAFHKSVDREFAKDIDSASAKVLSLTNKLLALTADGKGKSRSLENEDDVVDNFHSIVVDAMDQLLERSVSNPIIFLFSRLIDCIGHMLGRTSWSLKSACHSCEPTTRD